MDKLTAMRTFVAVVDCGSFSAAAQVLAVPKTRVSQRIQELEAALSTRLLNRTTRAVSLTEEGRLYADHCIRILHDIDAAEQMLSRSADSPVGRLRVSCMGLVAQGLLLPRLPEFHAAHPGISLTLSVTDRLANLNESGLDCAIRGGQLESSSLISRHLRDVGFGLYAAPDLLERAPPIRTPADLANLPLIKVLGQKDGVARDWPLHGPGGTVLIDAPARLETDDDQTALGAALAGVGVALCPHFAAAPALRAGQLRRVLPDWSPPARPIFAIYPSRRYPSAKLGCFLDWAETVIRAA